MLIWQPTIIIVTFLGILFSYKTLFRQFLHAKILWLLAVPLLVFTIGFLLRLSNMQPLIDIGYYFTDVSYLVLAAIYTTALYLGQLKYHGLLTGACKPPKNKHADL